MTYQTRDVLAAAYKGKRASLAAMRSHVVEVDVCGFPLRALCGRVEVESLADEFAADVSLAPTCAVCAKRDPRRQIADPSRVE